jgi:phage I-like protein
MDARYIEKLNVTDPQAWFRIFPLGTFARFGRQFEFTQERLERLQKNFKSGVPDRTVPVNREHQDEHGKVGDVKDLDLRNDGLYAQFAWTPEGEEALRAGRFQYVSPEFVEGPTDYDGVEVQDVLTGVGLTNSPFFGAHTALFGEEDRTITEESITEVNAMDETKLAEAVAQQNESVLTRLFERFFKPDEDEEAPETVQLQEQLDAAEQAREAAETKLAEIEAEKAREALLSDIQGEFAEMLSEDGMNALVALSETAREVFLQELRALKSQDKLAAILSELGDTGGDTEGETAEEKLNRLAESYAEEHNVKYTEAITAVGRQHPQVVRDYERERAGRQ